MKNRMNVLVSGSTGAGKTTLLNLLSGFIPEDERIVTIEDSAELQLQQPHVVRLETRPANIEGKGEVPARELVRNSLRMRPERIIVGEVRGGEALDMLQAMNTGHDGSLTTVHANTPRDALSRIENMVAMTGISFPTKGLRAQIASAIDIVVQIERMEDGKRRLVSIQEINGMEGDIITMSELFKFNRRGMSANNEVLGELAPTGIIPAFHKDLRPQRHRSAGERFRHRCGQLKPEDSANERDVYFYRHGVRHRGPAYRRAYGARLWRRQQDAQAPQAAHGRTGCRRRRGENILIAARKIPAQPVATGADSRITPVHGQLAQYDQPGRL